MRVVLDTNILARAAIGPPGMAEELLRRCLAPPHVLCLSPFVLAELRRVLHYPRLRRAHGMSDEEIDGFLFDLQAGSLLVSIPSEAVDAVVGHDPDDDQILATAVATKASVLCTLDGHLHQKHVVEYCAGHKIEILNDAQLLQLLRELEA